MNNLKLTVATSDFSLSSTHFWMHVTLLKRTYIQRWQRRALQSGAQGLLAMGGQADSSLTEWNWGWKIGKARRTSFLSHHHIERSSSLSTEEAERVREAPQLPGGAGKGETFCSELKDGQKLWKGLPLAFRVEYQSGRQWRDVHRPSWVAFTRGHGSLG